MITFKKAQTAEEYEKLYKLRYNVYCLEKQWLKKEKYPMQKEIDKFDESSIHFIATDSNKEVIGGVRLIIDGLSPYSLPCKSHPSLENKEINTKKSAEISRLIVRTPDKCAQISLELFRLVYLYSKIKNIKKLYMIVEKVLFRLLKRYRLNFEKMGEEKEYFGALTFPAIATIKELEKNVSNENSILFDWYQDYPYVLNTPS